MRAVMSKRIGDYIYVMRELPSTRAYKLLTKLGRILGPAFGAMAGEKDARKRFTVAVEALATRLDEKEVESIVKELAAETTVTGGAGNNAYGGDQELGGPLFEAHFQRSRAGMGGLIQWLLFAVEAQFGDFFGEMLKAAPVGAGLTADQASASLSTSPGLSGE